MTSLCSPLRLLSLLSASLLVSSQRSFILFTSLLVRKQFQKIAQWALIYSTDFLLNCQTLFLPNVQSPHTTTIMHTHTHTISWRFNCYSMNAWRKGYIVSGIDSCLIRAFFPASCFTKHFPIEICVTLSLSKPIRVSLRENGATHKLSNVGPTPGVLQCEPIVHKKLAIGSFSRKNLQNMQEK